MFLTIVNVFRMVRIKIYIYTYYNLTSNEIKMNAKLKYGLRKKKMKKMFN